MTWPKYVLLAWYTLGFVAALASISRVGKPRQPLSAGVVIATIVATLALVVLVVIA